MNERAYVPYDFCECVWRRNYPWWAPHWVRYWLPKRLAKRVPSNVTIMAVRKRNELLLAPKGEDDD